MGIEREGRLPDAHGFVHFPGGHELLGEAGVGRGIAGRQLHEAPAVFEGFGGVRALEGFREAEHERGGLGLRGQLLREFVGVIGQRVELAKASNAGWR